MRPHFVNRTRQQSQADYGLADTTKLFLTLATPSTFATCAALVFCACVATVPESVTTASSTSTLIVESLRSSVVAKTARALVQSQPSFAPVPIVRPRRFASSAKDSL